MQTVIHDIVTTTTTSERRTGTQNRHEFKVLSKNEWMIFRHIEQQGQQLVYVGIKTRKLSKCKQKDEHIEKIALQLRCKTSRKILDSVLICLKTKEQHSTNEACRGALH